jgi:hypothetical protein
MGQALSVDRTTGPGGVPSSIIAWDDGTHYRIGPIMVQWGRLTHDHIHVWDETTDMSSSLQDWTQGHGRIVNVQPRILSVNQYHRRIFRPGADQGGYRELRPTSLIEQSGVAMEVLIDRMDQLFRVVEPDTSNLATFGHEIRHLLLLACMEVEAGWGTVLRANGYPGDRWNTSDYVKLLGPLHLAEWGLRLTSYPAIAVLSPFAAWDKGTPTQSLPWYDAYNKVKHDRESNFKQATLEHTINAVAAAMILFFAQFGRCDYEEHSLTSSYSFPRFRAFTIAQEPTFSGGECYVTHPSGGPIVAVNYPF